MQSTYFQFYQSKYDKYRVIGPGCEKKNKRLNNHYWILARFKKAKLKKKYIVIKQYKYKKIVDCKMSGFNAFISQIIWFFTTPAKSF